MAKNLLVICFAKIASGDFSVVVRFFCHYCNCLEGGIPHKNWEKRASYLLDEDKWLLFNKSVQMT